MNFTLQTPSLQHLARVKIATHLWNQPDILTQVAKVSAQPHYVSAELEESPWKEIQDKVISKVRALPVPERSKKLLINLIKPVGIELLNWCNPHQNHNFFILRGCVPEQFCWSMLGTVDHKKTVEVIIKSDKLDVMQLYKLACNNCLEDDIRSLMQRVSEDGKEDIYNTRTRNFGKMFRNELVVFWTCLVNDRVEELNELLRNKDSFNLHLFKCAINHSNEAACEYFFEKLSQSEKDQVLVEYTEKLLYRPPNHNLVYLLQRMDDAQQERFLEIGFAKLLECLLHWPWQCLFVETAKRGFHFLDRNYYCCLMEKMAYKIIDGCRDYNYVGMLVEIWRMSSPDFKRHFLDNCAPGTVESLFESEEEDVIKLILDEASSLRTSALVRKDEDKVRGILMKESVVTEQTLNEWKRKIDVDLTNERDEGNRTMLKNALRLVNDVIENRKMR